MPVAAQEGNTMMNYGDGWMNGWLGGGMWVWTVVGLVVLVLLVVLVIKVSSKKP
jgi:uncharacterized membrane protein